MTVSLTLEDYRSLLIANRLCAIAPIVERSLEAITATTSSCRAITSSSPKVRSTLRQTNHCLTDGRFAQAD